MPNRFFRALRLFSREQLSVFAGNAVFFLLLSLLPLGALLMQLLSALPPLDLSALLESADRTLPGGAAYLLRLALSTASPRAALSLSLIGILYAASRGTYGILCGLDRAFGLTETRNALRVRLACALETPLLLAAICAALSLYVFADSVSAIFAALPLGGFLDPILRFLLTVLLLTGLFLLSYRILPDHRPPFRTLLPGALLAATGWVGYTLLYSVYLRVSPSGTVYGSLSDIAAAVLWLFGCMELFFLGALFSRCLTEP